MLGVSYLQYMFKGLYTYLKCAQSLSGSVYRRHLSIFIATERTPPRTDSLVFKLE